VLSALGAGGPITGVTRATAKETKHQRPRQRGVMATKTFITANQAQKTLDRLASQLASLLVFSILGVCNAKNQQRRGAMALAPQPLP